MKQNVPLCRSFFVQRRAGAFCLLPLNAFDTAFTEPAGVICENCWAGSQKRWRISAPTYDADNMVLTETRLVVIPRILNYILTRARTCRVARIRSEFSFRLLRSYEIATDEIATDFNYNAYQTFPDLRDLNKHLREISGFNDAEGDVDDAFSRCIYALRK